jgi:hypothetical protein
MNSEQLQILLNVLGKTQEDVGEFVSRIRTALADRDENALRIVLMSILAEQDEFDDSVQRFFVVIQLILAGSTVVKSGEVPECVAIGNEQEGFFASGVLLNGRWLLTSSHCREATKMSVGINVNGGGQVYPIALEEKNGLLALFNVTGFAGPVTPPKLPADNCSIDPGTPLRVVAFGDTDPIGGFFGQEREARFVVDYALNVRIFATSVSGVCPGDSGGPAFYYADADAAPRLLLGICDSAIADDCRSGGRFATLVGKKKWIEKVTKTNFDADCPPVIVVQESNADDEDRASTNLATAIKRAPQRRERSPKRREPSPKRR